MQKHSEQGVTLIETIVALTILAIGILSVARVFPSVSDREVRAQMLTTGSNLAREKMEVLGALSWSDPALSNGRHPGGTATEDSGPKNQWHRYYNVTTLPGALSDLKRVTVIVWWRWQGSDSTSSTIYYGR